MRRWFAWIVTLLFLGLLGFGIYRGVELSKISHDDDAWIFYNLELYSDGRRAMVYHGKTYKKDLKSVIMEAEKVGPFDIEFKPNGEIRSVNGQEFENTPYHWAMTKNWEHNFNSVNGVKLEDYDWITFSVQEKPN